MNGFIFLGLILAVVFSIELYVISRGIRKIHDKMCSTQIEAQDILEEILLQEYLCNIECEEQLLIRLRYMLEKKKVESLILKEVKRDRGYMLEYIDKRLQSIRHTPYYQGGKLQ